MRSTMLRLLARAGAFAVAAHLTTAPLHSTTLELRSVTTFTRLVSPYADAESVGDSGTSLPLEVATDLAGRISRIERMRQRLADDDGFLRAADEATLLLLFNRTEGKNELLRGYGNRYGMTVAPPDLFEQLDIAVDALWAEITRLAPTYTKADGHPLMSTLSDALERRLRVSVPKATFVGGMLRENEWQVRLSALGLPERRSMSGVLFYRLPDQPWVICREFEVAQKYFEKSTADGPGEITFGCLRLQQAA